MLKKCPRCDVDSELAFATKDWDRRVSWETFNYRQCPDCSLILLSSILDNLDTYCGVRTVVNHPPMRHVRYSACTYIYIVASDTPWLIEKMLSLLFKRQVSVLWYNSLPILGSLKVIND